MISEYCSLYIPSEALSLHVKFRACFRQIQCPKCDREFQNTNTPLFSVVRGMDILGQSAALLRPAISQVSTMAAQVSQRIEDGKHLSCFETLQSWYSLRFISRYTALICMLTRQ